MPIPTIPDLVFKLEEEPQLLKLLHDVARICYISGYTDGIHQAAVNKLRGVVDEVDVVDDHTYETIQQFSEEFLKNWEESHAYWLVWEHPLEERERRIQEDE